MTPYFALLLTVAAGLATAAGLGARGHLTITLRRRPERKPKELGQ